MFGNGIGNIYLCGFMGAGKSTIGPILAERLNWSYRDTDRAIEDRTGISISYIIKAQGEALFREFESEALARFSTETQQVIALGGGAVVSERNRAIIESTGILVCLQSSLETTLERLMRNSGNRPMVQDSDGNLSLEKVRQLYAQRQVYYEMAKVIVWVDRKKPGLIIREILQEIHEKTTTES